MDALKKSASLFDYAIKANLIFRSFLFSKCVLLEIMLWDIRKKTDRPRRGGSGRQQREIEWMREVKRK
jgi:hypothetical protein